MALPGNPNLPRKLEALNFTDAITDRDDQPRDRCGRQPDTAIQSARREWRMVEGAAPEGKAVIRRYGLAGAAWP